jgi:hypothetical protein
MRCGDNSSVTYYFDSYKNLMMRKRLDIISYRWQGIEGRFARLLLRGNKENVQSFVGKYG